jgi:lipoic acid synthetase
MEMVVKAVERRAIEVWGENGYDEAGVVFRNPKTDLTAFSSAEQHPKSAIDGRPVVLRNRKTTERRQRRLNDAGVAEGLSITERKPHWMRAQIDLNDGYRRVRSTLHPMNLTTVCEEAGCPNIYECWGEGTATFMINGKRCTRACGFCLVDTRKPEPRDHDEPRRVAEAVITMGLSHVVITAVARDDLDDGGALGFIETVSAVRSRVPDATIETLIPDFAGQKRPLNALLGEGPDVVNHNLETVARLQRAVRPNAGYARSLTVLARAKAHGSVTKSGLIVGLGENDDELTIALADLASVGVDIVTIGQYLRPTSAHIPVHRWVEPKTFEMWADKAREMGIRHVEASPLTRSSHKAATAVRELLGTP